MYMIKKRYLDRIVLLGFSCACYSFAFAQDKVLSPSDSLKLQIGTAKLDSIFQIKTSQVNPVEIKKQALLPYSSLAQYLKGNNTGLYVTEPSGEPGTKQPMYFRGISRPLLSDIDVFQNQPLVVLDGIPLVGEHPFAYAVQTYNLERIGPATNLLANINIDMVKSIEVLKDVAAVAMYGPNAANGAIVVRTKEYKVDKSNRIAVNMYTGLAERPHVTTINGDYENKFRKQFYDLYTSNGKYDDGDSYPVYLSDSLNMNYFGKSDWTDSYYNNGLVYNLNANLSGGGPRANFQFAAGSTQDKGIADQVKLNKYYALFGLNMRPMTWLTFSMQANIARLDRNRNLNLRDRFAQLAYFPDLSAPLSPNKEVYKEYLSYYKKGFDNNKSNVVQGYGKLQFDFGNFHFLSTGMLDYNEGYRDQFYHSKLMESNNFASNYYGYNQRAVFDNKAFYDWNINAENKLNLLVGNSLQWDTYRYNYAYAYKGVNDFIKVNLLEDDATKSNYLEATAYPKALIFKYLDRIRHNLVSFYGKATYNYDNKVETSLVLRTDGSSNAQPDARWIFTPSLSINWNIKNSYFNTNTSLKELTARLSAGRIGLSNVFDDFAQGPNYVAQMGFTGNQLIAGYNAIAGLVRPYESGWVGYNIPWAYTDQGNLGLDYAIQKKNFHVSLDVYVKQTKNQLINIPSYSEYGYKSSYAAGMNVQNVGAELTIGLDPVQSENFKWSTALNVAHNRNKLKALPNGLDRLVIGNNLLEVGKPLDQYWLLVNKGIYRTDAEVPQGMTYNAIQFRAGDPIWEDRNGDNMINDEDRRLQGHRLPAVFGNWYNNFVFGKWDLGINMYYNIGRELINQEMANRFDFINNEGAKNLDAIKEITYWKKRGDYSKYPLYNPWSTVIAYQADQDLFLENASFVKIRAITLGYNLTSLLAGRTQAIKNAYAYVSANNVATITSYSGVDPEIVDYTGYDIGSKIRIPRIYTLGIKVDF
ncbi:SusC/RagA family TonB-linked outer membrane protein [Sphingobacterium sp.]|uniref:SusC/RagA family TonB-linked outer membrane protein n=1 Tax=Sphingobacterium sp. TaxID=341027 RepID=UPI002FDCB58A